MQIDLDNPEIGDLVAKASEVSYFSQFENYLKNTKKSYLLDDVSLSELDIMTMFNPKLQEVMRTGLLSNATKERLSKLLAPDTKIVNGKITIFRATVGNYIRPGDFVTDNKKYAESHLDRQLGSRGERSQAKIIEKVVGLDELLDPSNGFVVCERSEFYYAPKYLQNISPREFFDAVKTKNKSMENIKEGYVLKFDELSEEGEGAPVSAPSAEFTTPDSINGMGAPVLASRGVTGSGDVPNIAVKDNKKKKKKRLLSFADFWKKK